jgi:hypothetical protein
MNLLAALRQAAGQQQKQYPHEWPSTFSSFTECVDHLEGADWLLGDAKAYCAWLHHEAEGVWPGETSIKGAQRKSVNKTEYFSRLFKL